MKHTKAPWKWEYKSGFIKIISSNGDVLEDLNKEANARLIAAAPELLDTIIEIQNNADIWDNLFLFQKEKINNAINKATKP